MAKLVFVCANCGAKYVNDSVCGACGSDLDGSLVHESIVSPGAPNARPAMPAETKWYDLTKHGKFTPPSTKKGK